MHEVMEEAHALAVLVAIGTLLGHRAASEEILLQMKASDQWAYSRPRIFASTRSTV